MDSDLCQRTGFSAGHGIISRGGTGRTRLGLHHMRDCFERIADYRGPRHPEPKGFRAAIGAVAVHLLEAKFRHIYDRNCKGIIDPTFNRLGSDFVQLLITNWSTLSEEAMAGVNDATYVFDNHGIEKFRSLLDILDGIFYLHCV